jgi:NAD(P)H dehydrogenase (quinone)
MKVLIIYDSKTGNTEKMAKAIAEGADQVKGVSSDVKKIGEKFPLSLLAEADGVAFGSPTRYADVTNEMKDFLEHVESYVKLKKIKLAGKKAGVFGSYGYDGAWIMEERLKGYVQALGYKVYDKVCVKIDTEFKTNQSATLADCKAWGKEFAEHLK